MVLEYLPDGSLEEPPGAGRAAGRRRDACASPPSSRPASRTRTTRGLVHRDLKPANVLFDARGPRRRSPTSASRAWIDTRALTEAGTVLGTASYISPEQAAGSPPGPASDVYSFGVILFRMLTGAPAVRLGERDGARAHASRRPAAGASPTCAPTRRRGSSASSTAALAKDPAARPADGAALLRELRGDARRRDDRRRAGRIPADGGEPTRPRCCGPPPPRSDAGGCPLVR